jgi:hypothetical protein
MSQQLLAAAYTLSCRAPTMVDGILAAGSPASAVMLINSIKIKHYLARLKLLVGLCTWHLCHGGLQLLRIHTLH